MFLSREYEPRKGTHPARVAPGFPGLETPTKSGVFIFWKALMAHNPAFQFYPGDWFREPGLQRVDLDVRGAWAELLMMMHHETPRGVSNGSVAGLARQLRVEIPRACFIIEQLEANKIAEVEYFDEASRDFVHKLADHFTGLSPECPEVSPECPYFVTLKNRRMVNEEKTKEYERLKKQKQRSPEKVSSDVPEMSRPLLHSPSPSTPTPTPKQRLKTLAPVVDKSTPWAEPLDSVRTFLLSIQAPDVFFKESYWLRIDQWLEDPKSRVYYFDELKGYLAYCVSQNVNRQHKDQLRGFRNWLSTTKRWRDHDAQRKAIRAGNTYQPPDL